MLKTSSFLVLLKFLSHSACFIRIGPIEDNFIISTEAKVRNVFNSILDTLHIQSDMYQDLQNYLTIHDSLLAITLQSYEVFKEIVTRIQLEDENKVNNLLDEALNMDNESLFQRTIINTIKAFLVDLDYHKSVYGRELVLDAFVQNEMMLNSADLVQEYDGFEESSEVVDKNEFWVPEDVKETSRRIYQGENTRIKLFPFMAVVLVFNQFYCAGTIIQSDLVLTAASCLQIAWKNPVFRDQPTFLKVRIGSSYYAAGGEVVDVKQIHFHPTFDSKTLKDNICLLRLSKHLDFSGANRKIKKVQFDRVNSTLLPTTGGVTIIGWGAKNHASTFLTLVEPLAFDRLDVYSLTDCQDIYSKEFVGENNFCAGFVSKGGGACNHDVGAPGVVNGVLTGIVTFGSPVCGTPDAPTVFTKLGFYANWIESIMNEQTPRQGIVTTSTTEKVTTTNKSKHKHSKKITEDEKKEVDEKVKVNDDEVYLTFVRALQAKDLMEVYNGKNKNSSEESNNAESTETAQDQDIEEKRKKILSLLKDLVHSTKKDKNHKHQKKHKTKSIPTTKTIASTKITKQTTSKSVYYNENSSSGSKEFMNLLKGKLLSTVGSKAGKHKHHKKSKKSKNRKPKEISTDESNENIGSSHKKKKTKNTFPKSVQDNAGKEILTKEIKKQGMSALNPNELKNQINTNISKTNEYVDYSEKEDYDLAFKKASIKKDLTKTMSDTAATTVKEKKIKDKGKSQGHQDVPVSFDYYEQYYNRQKNKKKDKIAGKHNNVNKTKDDEGEFEDNSSEYYNDDKTATEPVSLLLADNVDSVLQYLPNNFTNTSFLSSFVKSIYYNGNIKDTLFRADMLRSKDSELSLSLTIKDKEEESRRNKGFSNGHQNWLNQVVIANSFRHWLNKTLKNNASSSILYKKSDNEIYELLKLALRGI